MLARWSWSALTVVVALDIVIGVVRQTQRLEASGRLARGVAHDFRNLLFGISANTQLVRVRHAGGELDEQLDAVDAAIERASQLCRQLITYSGEEEIELRPVDLGGVVGETVDLVRSVDRRRIEFAVAVHGPCVVAGDPTQLGQIELNLLQHAAHETTGASRVSSRLDERELTSAELDEFIATADAPAAGRWVVLEIADDGAGIPDADLDRIFDRFFSTKEGGNGLGLSVEAGVLHNHGGLLKVDSEHGRGTTFTVLFPAGAT